MTDTAAATPSPALAEYTARRAARQQRADRLLRRFRRVTEAWKSIRLLMAALVWEELNARLHTGIVLLLVANRGVGVGTWLRGQDRGGAAQPGGAGAARQ